MVSTLRVRHGLISVAIAGVLGAQAIASFGDTDRYFPFLWYPMYAKAHFEGERLDVGHRVYAVLADGKRLPIDPQGDLHLDFWRFERRFARPLVAGRLDEIGFFLRRVVERYPAVAAIEVDDFPMIMTRHGPVAAPLRTVAVVRRSAFAGRMA